MKRCILCSVVFLTVLGCLISFSCAEKTSVGAFERISPEEAGFSAEKLEAAAAFCDSAGSAALLVLYDGKVVLSWGEVEKKYPIHSIRKAMLNSLFGIYVARGIIDTSATLEELGIDDIPPAITDAESQATVFDLFRSRSGVYHSAAAEADVMIRTRPERGSHAPGSFFYYNNWDFNVLGTIFEQQTGRKIFEAFHEEIARPIGMKDFTPDDGFYMLEEDKSIHPAYHMRMTAVDMALYGMLYMRGGAWNGEQLVPKDWIDLSTKMHSGIDPRNPVGYGCLWYVMSEKMGMGYAFLHTGAGIHLLGVFPDLKIVMVHRVDTEADDVKFSSPQILQVFDMVMGARRAED